MTMIEKLHLPSNWTGSVEHSINCRWDWSFLNQTMRLSRLSNMRLTPPNIFKVFFSSSLFFFWPNASRTSVVWLLFPFLGCFACVSDLLIKKLVCCLCSFGHSFYANWIAYIVISMRGSLVPKYRRSFSVSDSFIWNKWSPSLIGAFFLFPVEALESLVCLPSTIQEKAQTQLIESYILLGTSDCRNVVRGLIDNGQDLVFYIRRISKIARNNFSVVAIPRNLEFNRNLIACTCALPELESRRRTPPKIDFGALSFS